MRVFACMSVRACVSVRAYVSVCVCVRPSVNASVRACVGVCACGRACMQACFKGEEEEGRVVGEKGEGEGERERERNDCSVYWYFDFSSVQDSIISLEIAHNYTLHPVSCVSKNPLSQK